MNGGREILLAEDDELDVLLLQRAFEDTAGPPPTLHVAPDGAAAIEFFERREQAEDDCLPALVLLDLKMPRRNGLEVLQWIRSRPALRCIPVCIFSSSAHREDVERAYALGANAFLVKPSSTVQRAEVARFLNEWLRLNQPPLAATEGLRAAQAVHAVRAFDRLPGR